ncbi:hypothetical protein SDC9_86465 [bioreactor metagenome]|uniref:Uncharacterized protein n=1 Tax=bioreactor metagenome TaxID=1076179 RepID=A0A644ZGA8_9ZZZZ
METHPGSDLNRYGAVIYHGTVNIRVAVIRQSSVVGQRRAFFHPEVVVVNQRPGNRKLSKHAEYAIVCDGYAGGNRRRRGRKE